MSKAKKILLGVLILFVVIVLAVIIIVPMLVDVDRYRPEVVERITSETGKPAEIGRLSLTLFPTVAIRVDDFALGNPQGFPQGYFVKTKRIDAVVDGGALWNRQIVIKSLKLEDPEINLLQTSHGNWNFETHQSSKPVKNASLAAPSSFSLGVISSLTIANGKLSAAKLSASGALEPAYFEATGLSSELEDVDLNAFGSSLSQSLKPRHDTQIASAPWRISFIALAGSPEDHLAAQGTLNAKALKFQTLHVTSVKTKVRLYPKEVFFDGLSLDLYKGQGKGDVSFNYGGANPRYKLKAQVSGVDVAQFLQEVPSARGYMTGKMQGNMTLDGEVTRSNDPLAGMRGTGNMTVKDGNLPKLQLSKNLLELAKLSDLGVAKGDPGAFSSIAADLNIANSRITSQKITVIGNGVDAESSGSMTMAGEGTLNYQGVANLAAGNNQLSSILASMSGATISNGKMTFPFAIGGTLSVPKFSLKSMGAGQLGNLIGGKLAPGTDQSQQQSPANIIQGLADAFKKKKNP